MGPLADIPKFPSGIPAVAVRVPAITTLLLKLIDPPALSTNDRAPPDPLSVIGDWTIMSPVPPPAPASSSRETVWGFVKLI